ncbi:uncharacterized protein P174DRAFT_472333 [Aspergillus novofumigatus IBT 16806]|uniref:Uncharacterized protein n=1 Tax=Aspergillus novofumigatus (strain IBT 16806) TaxID=1392255 RepID=A0A2I1BTF5_ASPN1|nr:uncharacterized protein P174DRAFT_472333 [Aspergillus novofumigatus IBT 16806]PKX88649.1 hypothetical protein P174DRAFT_472333 [Aspergillus novofumigatus IBT 16806]
MIDLVHWVALQETSLGDLLPPLYIHIGGERISRHLRLSLLTMFYCAGKASSVLTPRDTSLGSVVFFYTERASRTFQTRFLKVFFDARNDSNALYAHSKVELEGIRDVQLMERACPNTDH